MCVPTYIFHILIMQHWIRLEIHQNILIEQLRLVLNPQDGSYMPTQVAIMAGNSVSELSEIKTVPVPVTSSNQVLLTGQSQYHKVIEIHIRACKGSRIDVRIRGIRVVGRLGLNEDELAASFSFLTLDAEEDHSKHKHFGSFAPGRRDYELPNKVYGWGLNDKGQLGYDNREDTKTTTPTELFALSKIHPIQLVAGSRCTFAVTSDGKVFACGAGSNGQLGLGHSFNVIQPRQITSLSQYVVRKVTTHSSGGHVLALTVDGKIFSWGDGECGQLGHGNTKLVKYILYLMITSEILYRNTIIIFISACV